MSTIIRNQKDYLLISTKALPAAGATANGDSIDLGASSSPEAVQFNLSVAAVPALVDAKTIIYTFEDSADNSSFAAIAELSTVTSTGAGGVGAAAVDRNVYLPPSVRRYVRVSATVLAAGGSNIAVSFILTAKL